MTNEELVIEIQEGRNEMYCLEELFTQNERLIRKIISPYVSERIEAEDLMQEAYLALSDAVLGYDGSKGTRFMSYADYHIRAACHRYMAMNGGSYRIPQFFQAKIHAYRKAEQKLMQEMGESPSAKMIAERMGVDIETVEKIRSYLHGTASLDEEIDDEGTERMELSPSDYDLEQDVTDRLCSEQQERDVWEIVSDAVVSEQFEILEGRYKECLDFKELGRRKGISDKDVKSMHEKALRRLRQGKASRKLKEQYMLIESLLYRGGMHGFLRKGSVVEYIAIKRAGIIERLKKHI